MPGSIERHEGQFASIRRYRGGFIYPRPFWRKYDKPHHLALADNHFSPFQKINGGGPQDEQYQRGRRPEPVFSLVQWNRADCLNGRRIYVQLYVFLWRETRFHWHYKPVSTASHRFQIPRLFRRVSQHLSQLCHSRIETTLEVNK